MVIYVRDVLPREFLQSTDPVPIGVAGRVEDLARAADFLVARGWVIDSIDTDGIDLLWPASWVDEVCHTDSMETPITTLTVWSNRVVGYVLPDVDVLVPGGSVHLELYDVADNGAALMRAEGHRFSCGRGDQDNS